MLAIWRHALHAAETCWCFMCTWRFINQGSEQLSHCRCRQCRLACFAFSKCSFLSRSLPLVSSGLLPFLRCSSLSIPLLSLEWPMAPFSQSAKPPSTRLRLLLEIFSCTVATFSNLFRPACESVTFFDWSATVSDMFESKYTARKGLEDLTKRRIENRGPSSGKAPENSRNNSSPTERD